jgi:integrase
MSTGHIRQRSAGSWEVRYELPRDGTGARRTATETVKGPKKLAQRRLRELLTGIDRGVVADPGKMTTGQWLEQWLAECKHTVAPKTWEERSKFVHQHLIPTLGKILLTKLTPAAIQAYYTEALTSGRLDGKGGLSPQTVRHHDRVLHVALDRARQLRLIATNPVEDAKPPKVEPRPVAALDPEQQAALLAAASGSDLYLPVLLAIATGCRRGEILGLAWAAIKLDAGHLHVVQVTEQTKAGVRIKPLPKTKRSRRTVPLPQTAIDALRAHRAAQAADHLRLGLGKLDLVFPGWAADPRNFSTAFARLADRAGIDVRFHDLRHGHVCDLLAAGMHPKLVSERAGHSSVGFTLDHYAHTTPAMHAAAAEQIDLMLRLALGAQTGSKTRDDAS